jgi:nitrous-oxide reductase
MKFSPRLAAFAFLASMAAAFYSCKPKNAATAVAGNAAKAYVAPGKYDEFYNFVSGGFSGQVAVYGIPSGRLLRVIPVFSAGPRIRLRF